ncbi:hypothetical protein HK097_008064 [Rhizophlyctis rosea]|uniref:Uncharacterized protein n=1 Tax=Rhizophlyctis rosea TaxID=64517 RepID=A0AAD5X466_9FUNG|nr:hypothetical protein HK097_008064 [Rhizophlyctis rosea]
MDTHLLKAIELLPDHPKDAEAEFLNSVKLLWKAVCFDPDNVVSVVMNLVSGNTPNALKSLKIARYLADYLEIMQLLLDHCAEPNRIIQEVYPLDYLLEKKPQAVKMIALLQEKGGVKHPAGGIQKGLAKLIKEGNLDEVVKRLDAGLDVDTLTDWHGTTGLEIACREGQEDLAALFIGRGANVHRILADGETLLTLAAFSNSVGIIKQLLAAGVSIEPLEGQKFAMVAAGMNCSLNAIQALVEAGANINSVPLLDACKFPEHYNKTALIACVTYLDDSIPSSAKVQMCEYLLNKDININAVDMGRSSALHYVTLSEDEEIMSLLLKHGADVHLLNADNATPLSIAVNGNNFSGVRLLLEHGASPNSTNNCGLTLLAQAAKNGRIAVAEALVKAGAKLDQVLENGTQMTPLGAAVVFGELNMVKWIVGQDVDLESVAAIIEGNHLTPMQIVEKLGDKIDNAWDIRGLLINAQKERVKQAKDAQKMEDARKKEEGKKMGKEGKETGSKKKTKQRGFFRRLFSSRN